MNILAEAIRNISYRIPKEVLREAFYTNDYLRRNANQSLDTLIRDIIFERWVRVDMDMVGGTMVLVPLGNLTYTTVDNVNCIIRIPRHLTQGRSITTALSVSLNDNFGMGFGMLPTQVNTSMYLTEMNKIIDSLAPIPDISSASVMLIDDNTIMVNRLPVVLSQMYLRCIISNDPECNNVHPSNYDAFRSLLLKATKAYIYNELIIRMGQTRLSGGMDLGEFKEVVNSYSDAQDLYQEALENWRNLTIMNDPMSKERHLKMVSMLI